MQCYLLLEGSCSWPYNLGAINNSNTVWYTWVQSTITIIHGVYWCVYSTANNKKLDIYIAFECLVDPPPISSHLMSSFSSPLLNYEYRTRKQTNQIVLVAREKMLCLKTTSYIGLTCWKRTETILWPSMPQPVRLTEAVDGKKLYCRACLSVFICFRYRASLHTRLLVYPNNEAHTHYQHI